MDAEAVSRNNAAHEWFESALSIRLPGTIGVFYLK